MRVQGPRAQVIEEAVSRYANSSRPDGSEWIHPHKLHSESLSTSQNPSDHACILVLL